ncbi:jeltraxin-like [Xenentodon cancila]
MLTFPMVTNTAHVKLITTKQTFSVVTICHRSFTDLKRDHALFSLATPTHSNGFLIFWDDTNKEIEAHIKNKKVEFRGYDYKLNMWHSICTTWDSQSGLVQLWIDGQAFFKKFVNSGANINAQLVVILGQDQDSPSGGFDINQSFTGMMSDVHMWDYILSPCQIQNYMNEQSFTPGNVLNWSALEYEIIGNVLVEYKQIPCH